ncbi:hypothetical protein LTR95_001940 [Oleoguttula sp. CCFEE 5521]
MSTAAAAVLGLTELLEWILLYVDPKTVLLAQRVDRTFRATVQASKELRVKLFLRQTAPRPGDPQSSSGYELIERGRTKMDAIDVDGLHTSEDSAEGSHTMNTLLLTSRAPTGGSITSMRWALYCPPQYLPEGSSALDMYVSSVPGQSYWRRHVRFSGSGGWPRRAEMVQEGGTLGQALRSRGWWPRSYVGAQEIWPVSRARGG